MNEIIQSLLTRRTVRQFKTDPVSSENLAAIVEAGMFAASSGGRQPWHFTVVENVDLLNRISTANREIMIASLDERLRGVAESPNFSNFYNAPAAIVISAQDSKYAMADCANAAENICLAAHALGLGSCYIASFKMVFETQQGPEFSEALMLPQGFKPYFAVAIGYQAGESPQPAERKSEMVTYIR
jgi:nitroreductase